MRLLLTGATGFVGGNVARVFELLGDEVFCLTRGEPPAGFRHPWRRVDLSSAADLLDAVGEHRPDAVIHLAIRNDLLDLYRDRRGAFDDYVGLTRRLVDAANAHDATFLYVSTDWVHDGTGHLVPEDEPVSPINMYGLFKALSEQTVLDRARHGLVARVGGVQGTHLIRPNTPRQQDAGFGYLVLSLVDVLNNGKPFDVWESDRLNSVATPVLAAHAGALMRRGLEVGATGILHLVSTQPVSRRELALHACEAFGLDPALVHFVPPPDGVIGDIPVPYDTSLGSERTRAVLGMALPDLATTLAGLREQWRSGDAHLLT